jgi:hypothetical protein
MTEYEVQDLINGIGANLNAMGANQSTVFGLFISISMSALVGSYIAGKRLDWVLTGGIIFFYTWVTGTILVGRMRMAAYEANIAEQLYRLNNIGNESAEPFVRVDYFINTLIFYGAVWAGVVFFVFYARKKFGADSQ